MKVIIAGSRGCTDYVVLCIAMVKSGFLNSIAEVVSGICPNSPDMLGVQWAKNEGIRCTEMPAEWRDRNAVKDPSAGRRRNVAMAKYAHAEKDGGLIALWDGKSPGTKHMIQAARSRGLKVYVHKV